MNDVNVPDELTRARIALLNEPDAHGQAALLLAESILHTLVGRGVISNREAVTTVQIAAEVKQDLALRLGESHRRMTESLGLLQAIEQSFAVDDVEGRSEES